MNLSRSIIVQSSVGMILAFFAGCGGKPPTPSPQPMPEVEVITVTPRTVPDEPEFIGRTEAFRPVEIRAQITGIIQKIFFTEGRNIRRGDKLYLIDPVPFRAAYLSAKGRVAQAQARLLQAEQDVARVKPLLEEQAVSRKDVDDAVAQDLAARATLESAQSDLVKAEFDMGNTLITAPVSGRIGRSRYYEGRLISAQTDLLTTIDQLDPMYVNISVPESYLLRRRRELAEHKVARPDIFQLRGVMTFSDGTIYPQEGVLDFADVGLRTETGMLQGRFVFPNPEGNLSPGQSYVYPGQFVKVRLKGYIRTDAILIPQRAVQHGPKGAFVYVVGKDGKAEQRPIDATIWYGDEWLIDQGLQPGEQVVVEGFYRIQPGIQVNAIPYRGTDSSPGKKNEEPGGQTS
ncbi:MAG: efflux transporter periplasmic adaptor subunit [Nitrosospira sp. 56-18]|nr:efflux RND transporter periplasmic adaptor subunit [Nitrosospira sp.]OJY07359.1 MAG: efflux transporter periplasmic adaptor subunit [Nitrosospira sp. 56-18]